MPTCCRVGLHVASRRSFSALPDKVVAYRRTRSSTDTGEIERVQGKVASERMGKITVALVIVIALLLVAGGAFLAFWNPPPPTAPVEKVIPDARFPK